MVVSNSQFRNGIGEKGSAIHFGYSTAGEIKLCTFENNHSNGGAIYSLQAISGAIYSNQFYQNKGNYADLYLE